jgi:hypothetical protein
VQDPVVVEVEDLRRREHAQAVALAPLEIDVHLHAISSGSARVSSAGSVRQAADPAWLRS